MQVKILRSFVGFYGGKKYVVSEGDVVAMPEGADWLTAGLAAPVKTSTQETAAAPRPATRTKRNRKRSE